jgi:hypothetical protein
MEYGRRHKRDILMHKDACDILTFKWPIFAYANAQKKTPLEVNFLYLGNKEI